MTSQRGSTLALIPAGVLVCLLLIGIAVDSNATLTAQRRATEIADLAAIDIANASLDLDRFANETTRDVPAIALSPQRAQRLASKLEAGAEGRDGLQNVQIDVSIDDKTLVTVRVSAQRRRIIRIGRTNDWVDVRATARAELRVAN
jgi:hypothetical protein